MPAFCMVYVLLCVFFLMLASGEAAAMDVHALLQTADQSRGNLQGISWEVQVESVESQTTVDTLAYEIKARGFDISGTCLAPPKSKGNKLLMTNNNMWFYKPGLSKPIAIAQRQKLIGHAAYGDIASTNYANDYIATPLPDESVNGEEAYVFDLRSNDDRTTYDEIKYWISKDRLVGIKAEFYTVSGKKFKTAEMKYDNKILIDDKKRPFISEITMYDELVSGDVTRLNMRKPKLEPLPDYIFNVNLFLK